MIVYHSVFFFFFQAEDGIRDYKVTGVQTCALPILFKREGIDSALQHVADALKLTERQLRERTRKLARIAKVEDRKSTRLNSSHLVISYAVFCLKKKKTERERYDMNL